MMIDSIVVEDLVALHALKGHLHQGVGPTGRRKVEKFKIEKLIVRFCNIYVIGTGIGIGCVIVLKKKKTINGR